MSLRNVLDKMEPHFHKGGKYEKWYALYEAVDTIFYTPGQVTKSNAHVRDVIDLKRMMIMVWLCTFPAMFYGMYNVGNQALTAIAGGATLPANWHGALISALSGLSVDSTWDCFIYGAVYFIPV